MDRPYGAVIFYNDEATENGRLVFAGHRAADGKMVDVVFLDANGKALNQLVP